MEAPAELGGAGLVSQSRLGRDAGDETWESGRAGAGCSLSRCCPGFSPSPRAMLGKDLLTPCSAAQARFPPSLGLLLVVVLHVWGMLQGRMRPAELSRLCSSPAHVHQHHGQSWCEAMQFHGWSL